MPILRPTALPTKENLNRELYKAYPHNYFRKMNVDPSLIYGIGQKKWHLIIY